MTSASTSTRRVSFVNYRQQYEVIGSELEAIVHRVLEAGDFILRHDVEEFEANFAAFVGTRYAVGTANCTDALFLAVHAAGIEPGDEVISVSHTFMATVAAAVHHGASPVLVEIRDDFNMDPAALAEAITPRTRAIMPVHLNGRVCEMGPIMEIANRHGLPVIEDAAQALGATYQGTAAGAFGWGACFSFYPAKLLGGAGDGGILVTNDEDLARRARALRDHGRSREGQQGWGFNSRLDNLQAAILNYKLTGHLPTWLERRRQLAAQYHEGLSDLDATAELRLPLPPTSEGPYHDVYQNYVVRSPRKAELMKALDDAGVEILINCPDPLHEVPSLGLTHFDLPRTSKIVRESFSLPLYPELTDDEQRQVIGAIRNFFDR